MKPITISHVVIMGDSLSDRGTLDHRYLFDIIPMSIITGLAWQSPYGRFTNGFTWSDCISAMLADEFIIAHISKKFDLDSADIADAVLAGDIRLTDFVLNSYNLDNDRFVQFEGRDFVRCYDEGGLSAHDYRWKLSSSVERFFTRLILATLEGKREKLLDYDLKHKILKSQKAESLVIEWSGANDLITVNAEPSIVEVDLAIKARIKNAEVLIKNGYRHFIFFNLPDLSLTPRYQNLTGKNADNQRANTKMCSLYFNDEFAKACQRLEKIYPHCSISIFDVNSIFTKAYNNPKKYGFDRDKLRQPFTTSVDFKIEENGTSPANGYMFWNDVHPSADMTLN